MGGKLVSTSGPALEKTADLMGMLTGLEDGDVFFIDEIHRMPRVIEEYLYPAMEDFKVDFVLDKGPYAEGRSAAGQAVHAGRRDDAQGLLSSPLRERFGLNFELDFYTVADLTLIVRRSAGLLGVQSRASSRRGDRAALARHAAHRQSPAAAGARLRPGAQAERRRRWTMVERARSSSKASTRSGLDDLDRRYLRTLIDAVRGRPGRRRARWRRRMQQEVDTLEEVVEPYLLHEGFILRTPSGPTGQRPRRTRTCGSRRRRRRTAQQPLPLDWTARAEQRRRAWNRRWLLQLGTIARAIELLASANLEDLGAADRTGALGRWAPVLHGDLLGVLDLALGLALHAVTSSHGWTPMESSSRPETTQRTRRGPLRERIGFQSQTCNWAVESWRPIGYVPGMAMERTLVIIKPDGVQRGLVGPILSRLEARGLQARRAQAAAGLPVLARAALRRTRGQAVLRGLAARTSPAPVVVACVEGTNAVQMVRNSVGATNPLNAAPGTIRGDLALDIGRNLIHASDAPETAERELALWFASAELVSYTREMDRWIFE